MQDRPNQAELIDSVRRFLEEEVLPASADQRLKFRVRVAAHVLAVAARERHLERGLLEAESARLEALLPEAGRSLVPGPVEARIEALNEVLASAIRAGRLDAAPGTPVWEHLRRTAVEKLEIANPAKLLRR